MTSGGGGSGDGDRGVSGSGDRVNVESLDSEEVDSGVDLDRLRTGEYLGRRALSRTRQLLEQAKRRLKK